MEKTKHCSAALLSAAEGKGRPGGHAHTWYWIKAATLKELQILALIIWKGDFTVTTIN